MHSAKLTAAKLREQCPYIVPREQRVIDIDVNSPVDAVSEGSNVESVEEHEISISYGASSCLLESSDLFQEPPKFHMIAVRGR